jgi:hypothetical protein
VSNKKALFGSAMLLNFGRLFGCFGVLNKALSEGSFFGINSRN